MLSEKMLEPGQEAYEYAPEVAKLERVARAADALMDKKSCRRGKEVVELETALADLGALGG